MSISIIEKPKAVPKGICQHKSLVPLRVVSFGSKPYSDKPQSDLDVFDCEIGDIIFTIPPEYHGLTVNATKGITVRTRNGDKIFVVRAYDIAQIILTNDSEPAPVL